MVVERGDRDAPSRARVLGDVVFSPGFVDIQVNGIGAVDFWRADSGGMAGRRARARSVGRRPTSRRW